MLGNLPNELLEDDWIPLACRHCFLVGIDVRVKEGNWLRQCSKCQEHTVVKIERLRGRFEIRTGRAGDRRSSGE